MPAGERVQVAIPGGHLALTLHVPAAGAPRAAVIVNCAMGVPQRFYGPFAEYLATCGFVSLTWDYRGVGESALEPVAAREVSLEQWAFEDLGLVLETVRRRHAPLPILVVGHSFGGQIVALPVNRDEVAGALLIACPSGYVGHWKGRPRGRFMWWLAHVGLPLLARVSGRFPASRLGLGADLPRRAALQWGRWLRHPKYLGGSAPIATRMASFERSITALSMDDDEYAPAAAIDALLALYERAPVQRRRVAPAAHGVDRIGHMGFFRKRPEPVLWRLAADELAGLLARLVPTPEPARSAPGDGSDRHAA